MNNLIVLHNSRCMKSRNALKVLEEHNIPYSIVPYLEGTLDVDDLKDLLSKLRLNPSDIVRKTEALYKECFKGKEFSNGEWLEILVNNPKLIERPILFNDKNAVVGRPTENVITFINKHYKK
ncbi:MAG: ArsC/Spx/MgsR family protein [Chitinophagales bacterium]